jgi:hypothetical protein
MKNIFGFRKQTEKKAVRWIKRLFGRGVVFALASKLKSNGRMDLAKVIEHFMKNPNRALFRKTKL